MPILLVAASGCGLSMLAAFVSVHLQAAGVSARAIGLNAAAAGCAALLVAPAIPALAARLGTARLLGTALVLGAATMVGFAYTQGFVQWLVLRALEGGCATVVFVLGEYWITTRASPERRGLVIGLYVSCVALGFALGPLALSLPGFANNRPLGLGVVLWGGSAVLLALRGNAPTIARQATPRMVRSLRAAPVVMLAALLHGAIETAGLNLLPVFALAAGAGVAQGALLASLFMVGNGLLQMPIGIVAARLDRGRLLLALAALAGGGAIVLAFIGVARPVAFAVGLLIWGGIVGSFYPVGLAELPRRFAPASLVGANSNFVMCYALGTLVGPPLVGAGLDLVPTWGFFAAMAGLNLAFLGVAALAAPASRRGRPEPGPA